MQIVVSTPKESVYPCIRAHITPVNDAPQLQTSANQQNQTGDCISLQLLASDVDSTFLVYSLTDSAA